MAAAQNLEITLDMVVKNQGDIATLFKQVDKLNAELKELQKITGGVEAPMRKMQNAVRGNTNAIDAVSKSARQNRQAMQMAGMQIGDFATQISTGSNPVQAFNQQIGQLGYALTTSATPALQRVGSILAGPWSIAILGATMVLGPMVEKLFEAEEAADAAKKSLVEMVAALEASLMQLDDSGEILSQAQTQALKASDAIIKARKEIKRFETLLGPSGTTGEAAADREIRAALARSTKDLRDAESELAEARRVTRKALDVVGQRQLREEVEEATRSTRQGAAATREYQTELQKFIESQKSYIQSLKDAVNPAGAVQREIDTLNRIFEAGALPLDAYNARLKILQDRLDALQPPDVKKDIDEFFAGEALRGLQLEFEPLSPELKKIIDEQDPYKNIKAANEELQRSYEAIGNAVANGFKGMITGAQSFGNAMKNIIQSVIDELFRLYVVQQIVGFVKGALGGIFGGASPSGGAMVSGPAAAVGGYPQMNKPVLVGERGPELFVPTGSGKIVANHNLGGGGSGMVINVDARGSSDPEAVRQQVQQGILEAAPSIVAAAQNRTINTLRRPRLAGTL